jgi:hypothetical protein
MIPGGSVTATSSISVGSTAGPTARRPALHVRSDGKFKMVQFADLHWSTGAKSGCADLTTVQRTFPCTDLNTSAFMARVLDAEAPVDLVIFTGDNIAGRATPDALLGLKQATQVVADRKIPWVMTLGNHDSESSAQNRAKLQGIAAGLPFSLSQVGPASLSTPGRTSGGNFVLSVRHQDKTADALTLYFLDSGDYSKQSGVSGYDWIHQNQIDWWEQQAEAVSAKAGGDPPPALAFFHIPLPEYHEMISAGVPYTGDYQEDVCSPEFNSGFFNALLQEGSTVATFVGHDHVNDFCGPWHGGIKLCYGGGTGYGNAYSRAGWARRSRVFELVVDQADAAMKPGGAGVANLTTWKRLDEWTTAGATLSSKDLEYLVPKVISGSAKERNYELVNNNGECKSKDKRLDPNDGEYTLADCAAACADDPDGCSHFSYRPGSNSQCYAEYPSEPKAGNSYCGEGFDSDGFDFYRLIYSQSNRMGLNQSTPLGREGKERQEEQEEQEEQEQQEQQEQQEEQDSWLWQSSLPVADGRFLAVLGIFIAAAVVGLGLCGLVRRRCHRPLSTREITGKSHTPSGPRVVGAGSGTTLSPRTAPPRPADSTEESDVSDADELQFCSGCGARLPDGTRFCSRCGAEVLHGTRDVVVTV